MPEVKKMQEIGDIELLNSIYRNAQMGRDGASRLIQKSEDMPFRKTLEKQEQEYQDILDCAEVLMRWRGHEPEDTPMMAKLGASMQTHMQTMVDDSVQNMAKMMIEGSRMGIDKLKAEMENCQKAGHAPHFLAEKLLKTEENNLRELRKYLS